MNKFYLATEEWHKYTIIWANFQGLCDFINGFQDLQIDLNKILMTFALQDIIR